MTWENTFAGVLGIAWLILGMVYIKIDEFQATLICLGVSQILLVMSIMDWRKNK